MRSEKTPAAVGDAHEVPSTGSGRRLETTMYEVAWAAISGKPRPVLLNAAVGSGLGVGVGVGEGEGEGRVRVRG